ncbi:PadR family transcriptional regulator [Mycolicibacterium confluentis]|nr:PadR family transcriptional regulator [Mycolicibacterium confluentis]
MHGYEMFQTLTTRRDARIVKVRPGSLYHVVARLAEENLIRSTVTGRDGNRPERTIFEITQSGIDALTSGVRDLVATPVNEFPRFVAGLAELDNLDRDSAVAAVRSRVAALEAELADMVTGRESGATPAMYLTVLDYLTATTRTKLDWLRDFADTLESGGVGWRDAASRADEVVL